MSCFYENSKVKNLIYLSLSSFLLLSNIFAGTDWIDDWPFTLEEKPNVNINRSMERISDDDFDSQFIQIIDEIKNKLSEGIVSIAINLSGNYITDSSIRSMVKFIQDNELFHANLVALEISNNRFTQNSLEEFKSLLRLCSNLNVNISINYFNQNDFNNVFSESPDLIKRIVYSPY